MTEKQGDKLAVTPVVVDVPLHQSFDYRCDAPPPPAGSRVRVSFGKRQMVGLVWPRRTGTTPHQGSLKPLLEVVDQTPLLPAPTVALLEFAARYYHHPPGEVFAAAVPGVLRAARDDSLAETTWMLTERGRDALRAGLAARAPQQRALLEHLAQAPSPCSEQALDDALNARWRRLRTPLSERGWIESTNTLRLVAGASSTAQAGPTLNAEQAAAVAAIEQNDGFAAFLLDGVTGSGKTEVYLSLIEKVIARNDQVLLLVPEIGLTPQLASRLQRRLGIEPTLYHSELTDAERARAWLAARAGTRKLFVATRSGVFLPLEKLGLVIVDEEHDSSLKQHEGFRYHARDLAVWRARQAAVPIVLGSATPSLETLANARAGRYHHLRLRERAGGARPPRLSIIDMNRFHVADGLAQPAIDAMRAHLERGKQVLVYINRRGYAPTLVCTGCGDIAGCTRCDAHMTVHHKTAELQCHHCGLRAALPSSCANCGALLKPLGEGTERVEHAISSAFPDQPMARIDSDTTRGRDALGKVLAQAREGKISILIGTQMLAKGHHLPNVTLVVIVNLDQGFFASDLRASERLAQSLVQVAGRAGRAEDEGEVLLQTAFPHHPLLATLATSGYGAFASAALEERRAAQWPPFAHVALLHAAARTEARAIEFLRGAASALRDSHLTVLGPAPATMLRRQNRYRYRLLLQANERAALQGGLAALTGWLSARREDHDVRWSLDVDPQSDL